MNTRSLLLGPIALALGPVMIAQSPNQPPPAPPPVAQAFPRAVAPDQPAAQQRVYGPSGDTLIARQTAEGILEGFRKAYKTDGAPRIVVYVNRALVDLTPGANESAPRSNSGSNQNAGNNYAARPAAPATPGLADQQTVREIERLFGRAFRHAGAQLADQKIAASLLPDQPGAHVVDQAAKDRQALANIADIAIEVLISSRNLVMPEVSGDATYAVPDIQATAIRLKDSAIIGQAAASDIIGKGMQAGRVVRQFDVRDITEATAIALMEDMLTGTK